ncbi:MAG: prolipoprotein diacylglyceryl transferase [Candidatus Eisenbacteria bacterium]|nr:prolipoprotein diacylglyceryl transferase [Candidatus Eisenbacteria bacterium]
MVSGHLARRGGSADRGGCAPARAVGVARGGRQPVQPILFELGPFRIHAYGLALALSFLIGSLWVSRRARPHGLRDEQLSRLYLWILVSALLGARFYYAFQHPEDFSDNWIEVFQVWRGGLTQYGGVIAALLAGWLYVRARGWSFLLIGDLFAPALALGEGLTRIGCFFNGCCFGCPTELPWGVVFPPDSSAHWALGAQPLHPSQLYLSLGNLILAGLLALVPLRRLGNGRLLALYLVASSVLRFVVDFARHYAGGDYLSILGLRLVHSQWVGLALLLVGLLLWWRSARRSPGTDGTDAAAA